MSLLAWIVVITVPIVVSLVVVIAVGRFLRRSMQIPSILAGIPRPCYRCGVEATTDFMGLHYCSVCRIVVFRILPSVRHDPPFGFPGSSGYLEFPKLGPIEEKKEA